MNKSTTLYKNAFNFALETALANEAEFDAKIGTAFAESGIDTADYSAWKQTVLHFRNTFKKLSTQKLPSELAIPKGK